MGGDWDGDETKDREVVCVVERRAGFDRRWQSERRRGGRRSREDRRGGWTNGAGEPRQSAEGEPATVRRYAFRRFDDRRAIGEYRSRMDRRVIEDRRSDQDDAAALTPAEVRALIGPPKDD
jgi:hypothetical protein